MSTHRKVCRLVCVTIVFFICFGLRSFSQGVQSYTVSYSPDGGQDGPVFQVNLGYAFQECNDKGNVSMFLNAKVTSYTAYYFQGKKYTAGDLGADAFRISAWGGFDPYLSVHGELWGAGSIVPIVTFNESNVVNGGLTCLLYTTRVLTGLDINKDKAVLPTLKLKNCYLTGNYKDVDTELKIKDFRKEEDYKTLIAEADGLYNSKDYEQALAKYREASQAKYDESYPKEKIEEINALLKEEEKLKEVQSIVDAGDALMQKKDYKSAIAKYESALSKSPDNTGIINKLANAKRLLEEQLKEEEKKKQKETAEAGEDNKNDEADKEKDKDKDADKGGGGGGGQENDKTAEQPADSASSDKDVKDSTASKSGGGVGYMTEEEVKLNWMKAYIEENDKIMKNTEDQLLNSAEVLASSIADMINAAREEKWRKIREELNDKQMVREKKALAEKQRRADVGTVEKNYMSVIIDDATEVAFDNSGSSYFAKTFMVYNSDPVFHKDYYYCYLKSNNCEQQYKYDNGGELRVSSFNNVYNSFTFFDDKKVYFLNKYDCSFTPKANLPRGDAASVVFFNQNRSMTATYTENYIQVTNLISLKTSKRIYPKGGGNGNVLRVFFSNNSKFMGVIVRKKGFNSLEIFDVESGKAICNAKIKLFTTAVFSNDDFFVYIPTPDDKVAVVSVATGATIKTLDIPASHLSISPANTRIMDYNDKESKLNIYGSQSGKLVISMPFNINDLSKIIFSNDDKYIIFGTNNCIFINETQTGKEVFKLNVNYSNLERLELDKNGSNLICFNANGYYDTYVKIYSFINMLKR